MIPLERFAALTETHYAVRDAVVEIEAEWGVGASLVKVAWRAGLPNGIALDCLLDLADVGLIEWCQEIGEAFSEDAWPVLGEVA